MMFQQLERSQTYAGSPASVSRVETHEPARITPPVGKAVNRLHSVTVMIVDRSGSMETSFGPEVVHGCNAFLDDQRRSSAEDGLSTSLLFVAFDDRVETVYNGVRLTEEVNIVKKHVEPRGMTALHDAIGASLQKTVEFLEKLQQAPGFVSCFILTDGMENSSRAWSLKDVHREINKLKAEPYNWSFTFAGANQDALGAGSTLGLGKGDCIDFSASPAGMTNVMRSASNAATRARRTTPGAMRDIAKAFTPLERSSTQS